MRRVLLLFLVLISVSFIIQDLDKKYIRNANYDIECYVSNKDIKHFKRNRNYYWYKSRELHHSVAYAGGPVLHDEFKKYYKSNQIAEQGYFKYGLKNGEWLTWHENGKLKSVVKWRKGRKQGKFISFQEDGELLISGYYKNNEKRKKWINHKLKDTTYYIKDSVYKVKPKSKLNLFIKKIFTPKDSIEKAKRKKERNLKRKKDSIERSERKKERKAKREAKKQKATKKKVNPKK